MAYLLDTNVFIQAKQFYYAPDFCPAFWEWLVQQNKKGSVLSIEKVKDELTVGNDAAANWARDRDESFFLPPDEKVLQALTTVSDWVKGQKYHQHAVNFFLQDADYYVVAHALAYKHTVVTHEVAENKPSKVKIPEVCIGLKVKTRSLWHVLRAEKARFVLGKAG